MLQKIRNRIRWWYQRRKDAKHQERLRTVMRTNRTFLQPPPKRSDQSLPPIPTEEAVQKTLDDILAIIGHWKTFWLKQYSDDGINEWIYEEFHELIYGGQYYQYGIVSSAIKRMKEQELINAEQHGEFWNKVSAEVADLRTALRLPDKGKSVIPLDQRRISVP